MICVPVSLDRHGPALGAQAGEARLRKVVVDAGGDYTGNPFPATSPTTSNKPLSTVGRI